MNDEQKVDEYINLLTDWQQEICKLIRKLVHRADPNIKEEIKFTNRPYFTLAGNVCALLATKDHVNIFIYDPIAPDPKGIINQGHGNVTARSIQIYKDDVIDQKAFIGLIKAIAENNRNGGWRKIQK